MATIEELAREAYDSMEHATREDGTSYTRAKDNAPEWVRDLIYQAHADYLPDDWRYEAIHDALGAIAESGEDARDDFADSVDVYNADLLAWVGSLDRVGYVDQAREEFGTDSDGVMTDIMRGQYLERAEVFDAVLDALQAREDDKP